MGAASPAAEPGGVIARSAQKKNNPDNERKSPVVQIVGERVSKGDAIVDYEEKVFEDIQAEPGEAAYILMHTVPFEGSVGLVNMLTATRINRKGFDTHLVLYGPGSLMAAATRGYPKVGDEPFPGALGYNKQLQTFMNEGGHVYACRFSAAALYGMRGREAHQPARCPGFGADGPPAECTDHADLDCLNRRECVTDVRTLLRTHEHRR
jgi:uncharacterized repeat protein (TIGR04044 family)